MRWWAAVAAVLVLLLAALPPVAAATGYTVIAHSDYVPDGPPMDPTPVEWWQIPFRIHLTSAILNHAPALLIVVNLLFLLNVWLFFGYRRIAKQVALEHETRTAIYNHIVARPGIHFNAIARELETNRGTLKYHLGKLQEFGMIATAAVEGHTGYFENRQRYSVLEEKVLIHLRNQNTKEILSSLCESREASRRELISRLGITGPSISWHMHRLLADGIVEVEKNGREKTYHLADAALPVLERHLEAGPSR